MNTFILAYHTADRAGPHYDLYLSRTEDCITFDAWALRKGIPTQHGVKHLAIKVADHSRTEAMFEGAIPDGYGKGTKEIVDEGTYQKHNSTIEFFGSQVLGEYRMVRAPTYGRNAWLIWRA
jgi:bifunctional non-homologous end joining protein LigD